MLQCLENATAGAPDSRRSREVFAIRDVLGEVPDLWPLLRTPAFGKPTSSDLSWRLPLG